MLAIEADHNEDTCCKKTASPLTLGIMPNIS